MEVEFFKQIIKTINEFYPESAYHARLKRKAAQIIKELEMVNLNYKKLKIMYRSFDGIGERRV